MKSIGDEVQFNSRKGKIAGFAIVTYSPEDDPVILYAIDLDSDSSGWLTKGWDNNPPTQDCYVSMLLVNPDNFDD